MATTFMNLNLPSPTITLGPTWATQLNTALETIDNHDHSSGKGQRIPSSGININADLSFNSNAITALKQGAFSSQPATLSGAANSNSVYVSGGNLYFTNGSGVAIQLTSGGSIIGVAGTTQQFSYTSVSSNLTIASADTFVYIAVDTSAARTITLPSASAVSQGRIYYVKDITGNSFDNAITLNAAASEDIDGDSSVTLSSNYGSWLIVGNGSDGWHIS